MFYRRGERYKGTWRNDMRDGHGVLWHGHTRFDGFWKHDRKHGVGKYYRGRKGEKEIV